MLPYYATSRHIVLLYQSVSMLGCSSAPVPPQITLVTKVTYRKESQYGS